MSNQHQISIADLTGLEAKRNIRMTWRLILDHSLLIVFIFTV